MAKLTINIHFIALLLAFTSLIAAQSNYSNNAFESYKDSYLWQEKENFSSNDSVLSVLGRWAWGPCNSIKTYSNYAYVGNGPTLHVLDVSDPANPQIVGEYLTTGQIVDIEIKDSLVYVASGGTLEILDITNPSVPVKLGEVNSTGAGIAQLVVDDTLAFVALYNGAVFAVDVSNPAQPVLRDGILASGLLPPCIATKDKYVYVGNSEWGDIDIVDATNPDSLQWVGYLSVGGFAESALVRDTLLYVGVHSWLVEDYLKIYSLSNLPMPQETGEVIIPKSDSLHMGLNAVTVADNYAYLATRGAGIFSIDVSNPSSPAVTGHIEKRNNSLHGGLDISFSNNNIFSAYTSGAWIVDATLSDSLKDIYFFPTCQYASSVSVKDNLAFVASGGSGLWILDISSPNNPVQISNVNTGGWAVEVLVSDSFAYITNWDIGTGDTTRGLWIIDILDIQNPQILSHHMGIAREPSDYFNTLARSGKLIFMTTTHSANFDSTLEIIDVSDTENPQTKGVLQSNYSAYFVEIVQDSFALLATPDSGLRIIDWHNPENPIEVCNILNSALGVTTNDLYAYVLGAYLFVVDISNIHLPELVSSIMIKYGASRINGDLSGNFLYWVEGTLGIVDVSNPEQPTQIAEFGDHSFTDVSVDSDLIVLSNSENGIWLLRQHEPNSIDENSKKIVPNKMKFYQNFPNPFNSSTVIEFSLYRKTKVKIEVFNITGQRVKTLLEEDVNPGLHRVVFDGTNLPSGLYFYRIKTPEFSLTKKMLLVR